MRDGLCRGNARLHQILSIAGAAMMIAGGIMSNINLANANKMQAPESCLKEGRCFIAGTLVLTGDGHQAIEDVEVGDLVWAYDEETGESGWKPVVQLFRNTTSSWICTEIEVDGKTETIKSTPGHMYYLPDNTENRNVGKQLEHASYEDISEKWVSAEDLRKGDKVLLSDGRYGIVKGIKLEKLDKPETTYNFEVADFHTYYVGENSILVHNAGAPCSGYKVNDSMMKPHVDGTPGKSQFLPGTDANKVVLDAANYADANGLWSAGNQAKVLVQNGPIGTVPTLHQGNVLTDIVMVTRRSTGWIHGWPVL